MSNLKKGDKGSKVKQLQTLLRKIGTKPRVDITGKFCDTTDEEVRDFQKQKKLKIDGIVGKNTNAAIADYFEKDVTWSLKDMAKPRRALDDLIARRARHDTWIDNEQKRLIGTKDKETNIARRDYDTKERAFTDKAFELHYVLAEIAKHRREFEWAKTKQQRKEIHETAKQKWKQAQKLNAEADKLKKVSDGANAALMFQFEKFMSAA